MNWFLKWFRRPGLRPVVLVTEEVPDWTQVDAGHLKSFMRSGTGLKLGVMLRQLTVREALSAIHAEPEKLPWTAGKAAGVTQVVQMLDGLALSRERVETVDPKVPTDDLSWLKDDDGQRKD